MAFCGVAAGVVLYLDEGVPVFDYFEKHTVLRADAPLSEGESTISINFAYLGREGEEGPGTNLTPSVNDTTFAQASMDATVPGRFGIDSFVSARTAASLSPKSINHPSRSPDRLSAWTSR